MVVNLFAVLTDLREIGLLSSLSTSKPDENWMAAARFANAAQSTASVAQFLLFLLSAVCIARWIYRAAWNVRHLGAQDLQYSAGMAVGWHFIPFANLVMPFRALREIWAASMDPQHPKAKKPVPLLRAWWTFWLVGNITVNIHASGEISIKTAMILEVLWMLSDSAKILLDIVFIRLMSRLTAAQAASRARQMAAAVPALEPETTTPPPLA